ncbi:(2Fe-2S) ferredoxin domain-containing protein [Thiotrichales bacterium HSG1]|nr:(2Fe-2S) ferredoxin domain-containing protein [Thiotrichales bacterium HSG1]
MSDSYYSYHVFFCTNQRSEGEHCCQNYQAQEMRNYLKKRTKKLGIVGKGKVRSNTAGCMDRCKHAPVMVIYPEGTWYTFKDKADIDEIITEHLQKGRLVERLLIQEN